MQMVFVPCDRNESALHMLLFCSGRCQYATHIAFFYAGNMPYASRLRMFFGRGMENRVGIGSRFVRGMENRVGIGPRFVRGMDFWVGIRFIRPLVWPSVGRMQYAPTRIPEKMAFFLSVRPPVWPSMGRMLLRPTRTDENRAGFWFVFRGGAEKGAGRGLCEKWGRRASIIIRRLLPLRARRRMGPIITSAHAFIIPNYVA